MSGQRQALAGLIMGFVGLGLALIVGLFYVVLWLIYTSSTTPTSI
jgi:hypothetical protein